MPIIRRDDTKDPIDQYIVILWQQKWLIVGVALVTAILVYFALIFVPSSFRVNSELFVNRLASAPDAETPNPETVVALLKSQSVIEKVRNDYVKAFNLESSPPVERFAKQFDVETFVLQDTSVRKEFSPVLSLQVEARGSSETRYIMDRWIRNFVSQFGNYMTQEAVSKRDAFLLEKEALDQEIAKLELLAAEAESNLPYKRKILAEKLDLLSPSRLTLRDPDSDRITLDLAMRSPRMMPGLLERYSEGLLRTRAGDVQLTSTAELNAIMTSVQDAQSSITEAEKGLADAVFQEANIKRQLIMLKANQTAINEAISRFAVSSAVYKDVMTESDLPGGGDIRALSMPVTPEARVWPKRVTSAAVAAAAAAILTMFFVVARNFLTRLSPSAGQ